MTLQQIKIRKKIGTEGTWRLSSKVVGVSNDENNFRHKLLLTNTQVSKLHKAFANNSSVNIKLSKTQLNKIIQSGRFLGRFLVPLLKTGSSFLKNILKTLAKGVLILLEFTPAASAKVPHSKESFRIKYNNINNFK